MTKTITLFSLSFVSITCYAEVDKALEDELAYLRAENYAYTASKILEKLDQSVSTMTVINSQQIRNMGARNLLDALRTVPGLGITQNEFDLPQVEVRGIGNEAMSAKVLLMVNNMPLDHDLLTNGSFYMLGKIPIDDVKQIEVVRSTGSALYGANAFLAVINILTKQATDVNGAEITARGGSFNSQQYNVLFGKSFNDFKFGGNFNFSNTNGFRALIQQDELSLAGLPSRAPGYANPHDRRYDFSWNAAYKNLKFDGRFVDIKKGAMTGLGNNFGPDTRLDWQDFFLRLSYEYDFNEQLSISSKAQYTYFHDRHIFQLQPNGYAKVGITNFKVNNETQLTYKITPHNTFIGGFFIEKQTQRDPVSQFGTTPTSLQPAPLTSLEEGRFLWSVYGQDMWDVLTNLRLMAGVRYDHYSDFGSTVNPRVGLNWQMTDNYAMRFSYGTAFRAPAFLELSATKNNIVIGNPNLKPEQIKTFELGFNAHFSNALQAQLTLYHSDIKDIIAQVNPPSGQIQYQNASTATTRGLELESTYHFTEKSYIGFNYVYQNALEQNQRRIANTPEHRANIMGNYAITDHLNWYADVQLRGHSLRETGDNRNKVAGYGVVNTALTLKDFGMKGWEANFSIYNLLDKNYVVPSAFTGIVNDLPQAGRAFFGSVRFSF